MTDSASVRIERSQHAISRHDLDQHALDILYHLKRNKYEAYIVGGAIRDLLCGRNPKDFDIATNATPEEVRSLFRNSRIIGRRFRIVHVVFDDQHIEVATLRAAVDWTELELEEDDLYMRDDNEWGDLESDSYRRDFTINAIYYDIYDFSLVDYTGGIADVEEQLIRTIGDPMVRFQEDPVRMLRALKFASRYGFAIEKNTSEAIHACAAHIHKASGFRVIEELFRIINQRGGNKGLELLHEYGLLKELWPDWLNEIGEEGFEQVLCFLANIQRENNQGRFVPLEICCAGLFLPLLDTVHVDRVHYHDQASEILESLRKLTIAMEIPKRLSGQIANLLRGQLYLIYFGHRPKQVHRYVRTDQFDMIWRVHDLAFSQNTALHPLQEVWLRARERVPGEIGGWVENPDKRDIYSFRGKTGGGRLPQARKPRTRRRSSRRR